MPLYLDHAATSPLRPEARDAFLRASELGGNASSIHSLGRKAKLTLEEARADLLAGLNATGAAGLVFTSGGTEANAMALRQAQSFDYLVLSAGEHDSLYGAVSGALIAPLRPQGDVDVAALAALLDRPGQDKKRPFVCVMLANNETGVINDIAALAALVRARDGWLHVDAVQALGKINIDFRALGADSLSLSAHKVGGGQGVGAFAHDRDRVPAALISGSGQELGLRAGTENIAGIAAFAAAFKACQPMADALCSAQIAVEASLKALGVTILGEDARRVPGIVALAQGAWPSALQLIYMDMAGICVSSGSACSSGKVKSSRIVSAMGRDDLADKALRVSAGWTTKPEDWQRFYDVWSMGYEAYLKRHAKASGKALEKELN
ncbi:aminotransferase class V-fold PLP-dependent enzyme [Asticcacaulis sp. EMRT-3]|uniref:cysteine desulfurase family protein n=1 Tax=Asticcacaulis sp. EMRT-3 TaxID=3040349 RepID=UPI0024AFC2CC|nr:aminotransferase class V-fold PLP-dependent enzyme [Asticcacaulis sp. EMRT-3]MDI7774819.1 aminotransferase class V-fold PLP-dependent enzyme [Asticcacaulis sp. EMRT-3]